MSKDGQRAQIDGDADRRAYAIRWLRENAPDDALQELAYWTAIRDNAERALFDAAHGARKAGHSWQVLGMAYGYRPASTAFKKFRVVAE